MPPETDPVHSRRQSASNPANTALETALPNKSAASPEYRARNSSERNASSPQSRGHSARFPDRAAQSPPQPSSRHPRWPLPAIRGRQNPPARRSPAIRPFASANRPREDPIASPFRCSRAEERDPATRSALPEPAPPAVSLISGVPVPHSNS